MPTRPRTQKHKDATPRVGAVKRRKFVIIPALLVAGANMFSHKASAFPAIPQYIHMGDHLFATEISGSATAQAFEKADGQSISSSINYSSNLIEGTGLDGSVEANAQSIFFPKTSAKAIVSSADAFFGKLKGSVTSIANGSSARADATATMAYMDVLQVQRDGNLEFSFDVKGGVEHDGLPDDPSPNTFANSSAVAQVFVWRYGPLPAPGSIIDIVFAALLSITPQNGRVADTFGSLNFKAGDFYWVSASLTLTSAAQTSGIAANHPPGTVQATADFAHTANFYFDPSAGSIDAGYTTASGFDYRTGAIQTPIPIPPANLMFASAVFCMVVYSGAMFNRRLN